MEVGTFLYRSFWEEYEQNNYGLITQLANLNVKWIFINSNDMVNSKGDINDRLNEVRELAQAFGYKIGIRIFFHSDTLENLGYEEHPLLSEWPVDDDLLDFLDRIQSDYPEIRYFDIGVEPVNYQQIDTVEKTIAFAQALAKARKFLKTRDFNIHVSVSGCTYKTANFFPIIAPYLDSLDIHWYGGGDISSVSDDELLYRAMNWWYNTDQFYTLEEAVRYMWRYKARPIQINCLENGITWNYADPDPRTQEIIAGLWYIMNMVSYRWGIYSIFHFYGTALALIPTAGSPNPSYSVIRRAGERGFGFSGLHNGVTQLDVGKIAAF